MHGFTVIQCTIAMNTVVLNREQKYILLYKKNKMHWLTFASARLGVKVEIGSRLTPDLRPSRPADVLVADWERGRPAAWDVTVSSPLTPALLNEAGMTAGVAAAATEQRKHTANDPKCQGLVRLGVCSPGCRDLWQMG